MIKNTFKFILSKNNQDGQFLVLGLILFIGLLIPVFTLVSNLSITTNASTQAHGMAYNLAFASANRAVDTEATKSTGSLVMYRETADGINQNNTSGQGVEALDKAYDEIGSMSDTMFRASGLFGDNKASDLKIQPRPAASLYTGYNNPNASQTLNSKRWAGFASVGINPLDALYATQFTGCNPASNQVSDGVGQVSPLGKGQTTYCWVDGRAIDKNNARKTNPENPSNLQSWAHYSSGSEVHLQSSRVLPFIGKRVYLSHVGVATFGRPCNPKAGYGTNDPAAFKAKQAQCRY